MRRTQALATVTGNSGNNSLSGTTGADLISGLAGNDTLVGGSGADFLYGGTGNDSLYGGNDNDTLDGGQGADRLEGGSGTDTVDYSLSTAAVTVNLSTGTGSGGDAAGDTLVSIERAIGSGFNDVITGTTGSNLLDGGADADSLFGGSGTDTLVGGAGADLLDGGSGTDTADYATSSAGVNVNLTTGAGTGGDAQGDTLTGIEYLVGSALADTLTGNTGNNSLDGGDGADQLFGGAGTDTLIGGDGDDTLAGGTGGDSLVGGAGVDTADYSTSSAGVNVDLAAGSASGGDAASDSLSGFENLTGSAFADTLTGDAAANVLDGGSGNDLINGGEGDDTLRGGAGADTLYGGQGLDYVDYSTSSAAVNVNLTSWATSGGDAAGDVLQGVDGIFGSAFDDTLVGFDQVGLVGDIFTNVIYGGAGNDYVDGRNGNDSLYGGTGNDTLLGGGGDDTLDGGDGNDSLDGGAGSDLIYAGDGNDSITSGAGDTVFGGAGDDVFTGTGAATLIGGGGADTFVGGAGLVIDGSDVDTAMDVLDLTGLGPLSIAYDPLNSESGVVTFYNALGMPTGTMSFANIETVIPCFTPGTRIACETGEIAVEDLRAGDRVMTRDHGLQVLRWIGRKVLSRDDLTADARLQPVLISAGALGAGWPVRDMRVSRQHRMLVTGPRAELLFGSDEVLIRAEHLTHLPGVALAAETEVTYLHLLFDQHEVVLSDGTWSESFQPGDRTLAGLDHDARDELFALFPALAAGTAYAAARPTLRKYEAKVLTAA